MTATVVEADPIRHLDPELSCDAPNHAGDRQPARWILYLRCGCIGFSCDRCKQATDRLVALYGDMPVTATCRRCGRVERCLYRDLSRIEPL